MSISIPTSSRRSAQPSRPPPSPVYTMMAAAQMHSEGRLVQPQQGPPIHGKAFWEDWPESKNIEDHTGESQYLDMHQSMEKLKPKEGVPDDKTNYDDPTNDPTMLLLRYKRIMEGQQAP